MLISDGFYIARNQRIRKSQGANYPRGLHQMRWNVHFSPHLSRVEFVHTILLSFTKVTLNSLFHVSVRQQLPLKVTTLLWTEYVHDEVDPDGENESEYLPSAVNVE